MEPEYEHDRFVVIESEYGEWVWSGPEEYFSESDLEKGEEYEVYPKAWWYRLSASGYMDATDWTGPFDTMKEAMADLESTYEIDPETGEELEY